MARVALSELDENRFGIRTARANGVTAADVDPVMGFCQREAVQMLIVRVDTQHLDAAQQLEARGCQLMDTLLYYRRDLIRFPVAPPPLTPLIRPAQDADVDSVDRTARAAFRDYVGHYHADPRLDDALCDDTYADWAVRSVTHTSQAQQMRVVEHDGRVVGFIIVQMLNAQQGDVSLVAVAPEAQGQGLYKALLHHGENWCQQQGAAEMVYSTQLTNVVVQRVLTKRHYALDHSVYTFHKWFDR